MCCFIASNELIQKNDPEKNWRKLKYALKGKLTLKFSCVGRDLSSLDAFTRFTRVTSFIKVKLATVKIFE